PRLFAVALTGGDDYELALSIPASKVGTFLAAASAAGIEAVAIGRVRHGEGVAVLGDHPALADLGSGSYRHF
ncbi:UNVERIFIED_CONTAM: hypothetical protein NY100_19505, partial [Prevotella sp. 15_C9]